MNILSGGTSREDEEEEEEVSNNNTDPPLSMQKDVEEGWDDSAQSHTVLKKGRKNLLLSNARFNFLDISNFTPSGCSYDSYLKGFQTVGSKMIFPGYVSDLDKMVFHLIE